MPLCYAQGSTMAEKNGSEQPIDLGELLSDLAVKIERVKQLYEQYFMGIEKIEPQVARKEVSRAMLTLQQQYIRNTGLRFKFNTMLQKWNIYTTYWNRTLREIELGTYTRHLQRVRQKALRDGTDLPREMLSPAQRHAPSPLHDHPTDAPVPRVAAVPPPIPAAALRRPEIEDVDDQPARPPAPPRPAVAPRPRTPPNIPGMSEDDLRALHRKFTEARRASGEKAQVSYETLVTSLAKQVPNVLKQSGASGVRFDVAVQGGKAVVKAFPTK
jgi:hypothetical protein